MVATLIRKEGADGNIFASVIIIGIKLCDRKGITYFPHTTYHGEVCTRAVCSFLISLSSSLLIKKGVLC